MITDIGITSRSTFFVLVWYAYAFRIAKNRTNWYYLQGSFRHFRTASFMPQG